MPTKHTQDTKHSKWRVIILVPKLCLGAHSLETLFRVSAKRSFADLDSQTEFGNQVRAATILLVTRLGLVTHGGEARPRVWCREAEPRAFASQGEPGTQMAWRLGRALRFVVIVSL